MKFKYSKLRGKIVEKYGTQERFADAIGLSNTTVTKKLTGNVQFTQTDIIKWCAALGIALKDVGAFYFD